MFRNLIAIILKIDELANMILRMGFTGGKHGNAWVHANLIECIFIERNYALKRMMFQDAFFIVVDINNETMYSCYGGG